MAEAVRANHSLAYHMRYPGRGTVIVATVLVLVPFMWPITLYVGFRFITNDRTSVAHALQGAGLGDNSGATPAAAFSTVARSSDVRSRWAIGLVGLTTFATIAELAVLQHGLDLINSDHLATSAQVRAWASSIDSALDFYLGSLVLAAIAVLAWLSRVVDNIPALTGTTPVDTPRAAIGWWFVPFANLLKPCDIVRDGWARLATRPEERRATVIYAWWLVWIAGLVGDRVLGVLPFPNTVAGFDQAVGLESVALIAQIVGGALFIWIIWEIERRSRHRSVAAAASPTVAAAPAVVPASNLAPAPDQAPAPVPAPAPVLAPVVTSVPVASTGGGNIIAFCPMCGSSRIARARFCGSCGQDLEALASA